MELLTLGGIAAVVLIVVAACYAIYKALTRETSFEEAYGTGALKLLANQGPAEKAAKPKNKRYHPKRKHSPKAESRSSQQEPEEAAAAKIEEVVEEEKPAVVEQQQQDKPNPKKANKTKVKSPASKIPTANEKEEVVQQKKAAMDEAAVGIDGANGGPVQQQAQNTSDNPAALSNGNGHTAAADENNSTNADHKKPNGKNYFIHLNDVTAAPVERSQKKDPFKKPSTVKDLNMAKVLDRLREIGGVEPEYLNYLHGVAEEQKAKESKLRTDLKEAKTERAEMEKKMKLAVEGMDQMRSEIEQLHQQKREQNERHLVFEQTVRNKLIETHQLKEENKKLADTVAQLQARLAQMDSKLQAAQQDSHRGQEAEKAAKKLMHDYEAVFKEYKANQAELNKERELRQKHEQEAAMAKQMVDKLGAELNAARIAYANEVKGLKEELDRRGERLVLEAQQSQQRTAEVELQVRELTGEVERMSHTYQTVKTEMVSARQELDELKLLIAELNGQKAALENQLADQQTRNNDLREANYKLMESIKQLQASRILVNGTSNGHAKADGNDTTIGDEQRQQLERLMAENKQYKLTLDSLNNQLEEVSRIAREMEREKDAKIALIQERLARLEELEVAQET